MYKLVTTIIIVIVFQSCVNNKISMNYYWQHGKIELPENYKILTEESTKDSTIVILKFNKEQIIDIVSQIVIKDNYIDSMYVSNPEIEISNLFKGSNWGKYQNGYFYQSSRNSRVDRCVVLDTTKMLFSFKGDYSSQ